MILKEMIDAKLVNIGPDTEMGFARHMRLATQSLYFELYFNEFSATGSTPSQLVELNYFKDQMVVDSKIDDSGELTLKFENGVVKLPVSNKYENWELRSSNGQTFFSCLGEGWDSY